MAMLNIATLTCGYDVKDIIKNISFTVNEGDFLGIIGPNGAGKTTLFRAVTGALKPWNGNVSYKGVDISKILPHNFAREVAVIPQILEIPFSFTVEEFVTMGRFPHTGRFEALKERVKEARDDADAKQRAEQALGELESKAKELDDKLADPDSAEDPGT